MQEKEIIWCSETLAEALKVKVPPNIKAGKIQFNSKDIEKNNIFIALAGNRDGHEFVQEAIKKGASCVIIDKNLPAITKDKLIQVQDSSAALTELAIYKRTKSIAKFIAITGSVAKTSTKEIISQLLSIHGKTYTSNKNFNNFLGVRLCLASMADDVTYAVFELGMNRAGEIRELTKLIRPDIAIITAISESHIEFLGSIEKITDAKCEIFEGLDPKTGTAIVNGDIDTYSRCLEHIQHRKIRNICIFGQREDANIRFLAYKLLADKRVEVKFSIGSIIYEFVTSNIPDYLAFNFTAGFAIINLLGLPVEKSIVAIKSFQALMGRGKLVSIDYYGQKLKIICDHYNSNPQSLKASLTYLAKFDHRPKIAVLGDMRELGVWEKELHRQMIEYIIAAKLDMVFLIGEAMSNIKEKLVQTTKTMAYSKIEELITDLEQNKLRINTAIMLVKGSNSLRLHKLLTYLGVKDAL